MDTISALSAKQALVVLLNSDIDIYSKIPQKLICLLREIASECSEEVCLKENTAIVNQPISDEAKVMLAIMYKDYIASKDEKEKLNKIYIDKQNEIYNIDNIFKNNKIDVPEIKHEETGLVKVNNEKWYKKLFTFFKRIFRKK